LCLAAALAGFAGGSAIAVDPGSAEATVRLANYHEQAGNDDMAAALLQRATRTAPEDPLVLSTIAAEAAASGDLYRAIELRRRSVQNDPLYIPSRWNLANWLYLAGRLDEARAEFLRLRDLNAADIRHAVRLADLHLLTGEYAEALALAAEMTVPADRYFISALAYRGQGREP
jgi:tetratricopeptide (TPR) repeat protein